MRYDESLKNVRIIAILDMVFSIFPVMFYTVFSFIFGFIVMVGQFNTGYEFLDWFLAKTMTIEPVTVDFENPGQTADVRMFRCSVWGIAIIFNLIELTMALILLHAISKDKANDMKSDQPFIGWMLLKAMIIFVMFILIVALLSTGSQFVGLLISIFYLIYRGFALWVVYRHIQVIRDMGG